MKYTKKEIRKEKTIGYLTEIMDGEAIIFNPMDIDIPGFGKVTATSMVNYHQDNGKLIPYFTFKRNKKEFGEFTKEGRKYFVTYNGVLK